MSDTVITAAGMTTPVGASLIQSCASVRAGISRFRELEDYICEPEELDWSDPEPLIGARVPSLDLDACRISELLLGALQDLIRSARLSRAEFGEMGLYIALPPAERPGSEDVPTQQSLAQRLEQALAVLPRDLRFFPGGNVAFSDAAQQALDSLQQGAKACIVVGVDSWHDFDTLEWLDQSERLRSKRNLDGLIPGEAGAAILIESRAAAEARGADALAELRGVARDSEPNLLGSEQPSTGGGLARAITALPEAGPFEWVACDLNGESYRAREWGHCQVRLSETFRQLAHLWHPADCYGDLGAASGAALAALVARAFERGYAPASRCLLWLSAEDDARAALVLGRS